MDYLQFVPSIVACIVTLVATAIVLDSLKVLKKQVNYLDSELSRVRSESWSLGSRLTATDSRIDHKYCELSESMDENSLAIWKELTSLQVRTKAEFDDAFAAFKTAVKAIKTVSEQGKATQAILDTAMELTAVGFENINKQFGQIDNKIASLNKELATVSYDTSINNYSIGVLSKSCKPYRETYTEPAVPPSCDESDKTNPTGCDSKLTGCCV